MIDANEPVHIRSAKHPEANGRRPIAGETGWTFDLEVENGRRLFLHLGTEDLDALRDLVRQIDADESHSGDEFDRAMGTVVEGKP